MRHGGASCKFEVVLSCSNVRGGNTSNYFAIQLFNPQVQTNTRTGYNKGKELSWGLLFI